MFLVAVGFWNFVGAGVFGFLVNLPIVSYYQIGTALTANHAHGAMMGVYGMMAVGLALFALRYIVPAKRWPDRLAKISFWSLNIGLAWMMFVTLLPLGVLQLFNSVNEGYYEARTLGYISEPGNVILEWMRMPGDVIFIVGGILPFVWITWLGIRYGIKATTHEVPPETLFVEEHPEAEEDRTGVPVAVSGTVQEFPASLRLRPAHDRPGRGRRGGARPVSGASLETVGVDVWLASGYCLLLVGLAYAIDALARRAASAAEGGASGGFSYHEDHDAWTCPEDQWLWPQSFDPDNRVMRYRGSPTICNACPVKDTCTTSSSGREVQRASRRLAGLRGGPVP